MFRTGLGRRGSSEPAATGGSRLGPEGVPVALVQIRGHLGGSKPFPGFGRIAGSHLGNGPLVPPGRVEVGDRSAKIFWGGRVAAKKFFGVIPTGVAWAMQGSGL